MGVKRYVPNYSIAYSGTIAGRGHAYLLHLTVNGLYTSCCVKLKLIVVPTHNQI